MRQSVLSSMYNNLIDSVLIDGFQVSVIIWESRCWSLSEMLTFIRAGQFNYISNDDIWGFLSPTTILLSTRDFRYQY